MLSKLFGFGKPTPAPKASFYDRLMTEPIILRFMVNNTEIHRQIIPSTDVIRHPNGNIFICNEKGFPIVNNTNESGTLNYEFWIGSERLFWCGGAWCEKTSGAWLVHVFEQPVKEGMT